MTKKDDPKKPADKKARYLKACEFIEQHLHRQEGHAMAIFQTGRRIAWIQNNDAYREDGFKNFDEWREQRLRFSPDWTAKYVLIGNSFKASELRQKQLGVQALTVIARVDKPLFRDALLKFGERHEAGVLRSALRRAMACSTEERGVQAIQKVLERPEGSDARRTLVSSASLPIAQHCSRLKRRLSTAMTDTRSLRQRLENREELTPEDRDAISQRLQSAQQELWSLSAALGVPGKGESAPLVH